MLSTSTIHPALLRALPSDGGAPGNGADPAGFSSLLRQTQASAPPPPQVVPRPPVPMAAAKAPAPAANEAPKPPEAQDASASAENEGADASAASAEPADAAARSRGAARTKARDAQPRSARGESAGADAASPSANQEATAPASTDAAGAQPGAIDPQIAQWLAAQQRPAAGDKRPAEPASGADTGAKTDPKNNAASALRGAKGGAEAADAAGPSKAAASAAERAEPATAFAAALAERVSAEPAPNSQTPPGAAPIGALAGPATPTTQPRDVAAPTVATLPTPVDAPEFAQALGVQLSVFAKDGVQRAELHLNPAEMGPVSVQIVMDGTQARIDFGADVAATRHAIESGLPELASALRDAGFTLAGGGVSQQSAGQRGDGGQPGPDAGGASRAAARAVSDDGLERVVSAARRIVTPGGVDLYA